MPMVASGLVFVVEDDERLRRVVQLALRIEGIASQGFADAEAALATLQDGSQTPAAIILDLGLPGMDGREFFRRIRRFGFHMPVLILSAIGAESAARELGADAALEKPFDPEVLVVTLRTIVERAIEDHRLPCPSS